MAIFNFNNGEEALIARSIYYGNAGFTEPRVMRTVSGIRFIHEKGLDSTAYSEKYLKNLFTKYGQHFRTQAFATIGVAYFNF